MTIEPNLKRIVDTLTYRIQEGHDIEQQCQDFYNYFESPDSRRNNFGYILSTRDEFVKTLRTSKIVPAHYLSLITLAEKIGERDISNYKKNLCKALKAANKLSGDNAIIALLNEGAPQTLDMLIALDSDKELVFNSIDDKIIAATAFFSQEKNDTAPVKEVCNFFLRPLPLNDVKSQPSAGCNFFSRPLPLNDVKSQPSEDIQSQLTEALEKRFQRAWPQTNDLITYYNSVQKNSNVILSDENIAKIVKSLLVRDDYPFADLRDIHLSDGTLKHLLHMSVEFPETSELAMRRRSLVNKFDDYLIPSLFDSTENVLFQKLIERRDICFFETVNKNLMFGKKISTDGLALLNSSIISLKQKMDDEGSFYSCKSPAGEDVQYSEQDNLCFRWAIFQRDQKTIKFYHDHPLRRISQGVLNELLYTCVESLTFEDEDKINKIRYFECDPDVSIVKQLIDMGAQIECVGTHVLTNLKSDKCFSSQFKIDLFTYLVGVYRQQKPNNAEEKLRQIIKNPYSIPALQAYQDVGVNVDIKALATQSPLAEIRQYCLGQLERSNDHDELMDYFLAIVSGGNRSRAESFIVKNRNLVRANFPFFIANSYISAPEATEAVWKIVEPCIHRSLAEDACYAKAPIEQIPYEKAPIEQIPYAKVPIEQIPIDDYSDLKNNLMDAFNQRCVDRFESLLNANPEILRETNYSLLQKFGVPTPLYSAMIDAAKRDRSARKNEALIEALELHCGQTFLFPKSDFERPLYTIIHNTDLILEHPRKTFEILSRAQNQKVMSYFWQKLMRHVVRGRKLLQADLA